MRITKFAWIPAVLLFAGAVFSQISQGRFLPYKELLFPEVVAGGQYQTWVTVTNRGTQPWDGTLNFYTGDKVSWNPYVNGVQLSGGSLAVVIPSKTTNTFKVTLPGNTEGGYLIAKSNDISLDSFLDGNLTYYISNGGSISDSVGILPSKPILASVIPFEDFSSLCFAFVNADTQGRTATITITPYSDANVQVADPATITLDDGEYKAQYMWQTFPSVPDNPWRGRIEIHSDAPVGGVALTQAAGGQVSSLPLDATTRTYSLVTSSAYIPFTKMTFWTEGLFVSGYMVITGEPDLLGLFGQIDSDNSLELHYRGFILGGSREIFGLFKSQGTYTPAQSTVTGTFETYIPSLSSYRSGTFTGTQIP